MRRVRLFVSHSSHTPEDVDWLTSFVAALRSGEDAVEVLYDKEQIHSGDQWRGIINDMLYHCDAGVVLLTADAVRSDWVIKEANILDWRYHGSESRFAILPVLRGVTSGDVEDEPRWRPVNLGARQYVQGDDPELVAAEVRARLGGLGLGREATPLDLIADDIARHLGDCSRLRWLSAWTDLAEPYPAEMVDRPDAFALALARWMLKQKPPALNAIAGVLGRLGEAIDNGRFQAVLRILQPLWVDPESADTLLRAHRPAGRSRHVGLPCRHPGMTAGHYIAAAHIARRRPVTIMLNQVHAGYPADAVEVELLAEVLEMITAQAPDATEDDARDWLQDLSFPCYVVLPAPIDAATTRELRSRFGAVTFIHCAPDAHPDDSDILHIDPPLDADLETAVRRDWIAATNRFATR